MHLYRVTRRPHADLSGAGGLQSINRWNVQPAPIIYAAQSRALSMLEVLVHLSVPITDLPDDYIFQVIDAAAGSIESVTPADIAPGGRAAQTATFGTQWLNSQRSLLLRVPSIIVPQEYNILFNPKHPTAAEAVSFVEAPVEWDDRLL